MQNTRATAGQTLVDVAMRETGMAANVFELARLNNRSITDLLAEDESVSVGGKVLAAKHVFKEQAFQPVSMDTGQGIGFVKIGIDFIID